MIAVERVNEIASKNTTIGWFAGLAWFRYSNGAQDISYFEWAILIVIGMFVASIVIGGGMAMVAAAITKFLTGKADASPNAFAWMAYLSPLLAFFAASPVARWFIG